MGMLAASNFPIFGLFWVIFGGMFCLSIVSGIVGGGRAKKNLTALAERLGFTVTPNFRIPALERSARTHSSSTITITLGAKTEFLSQEFGIQGTVRGRGVRFSKYTTGSGKSSISWVELAVAAKANGFIFSLQPENFVWKIFEFFGQHEIKIGDEEFDKRWRINANDAPTLQMLLLPELRAKIEQTSARFGEFYLDHDWIRYREQGTFSDAKRVARLEGMVGLMCDLAQAIEVAAENYRPLSPGGP